MIKIEIEEMKLSPSKIKPTITKENQDWLEAILSEVQNYNRIVRRLNEKFDSRYVDLDKNLNPYYKDLYEN
jgi:16S rRNA U516 pseudouridylate synthase RsuA-like enzyme